MGNTWNMSEYDAKDGTTVITVLPIRTESAKSLVEAAHRQSLLQKRKTGCRELVQSNSSLPKATPSIHLHCSTCTCPPPSPLDTAADDETLARRIQAASAVCRAKALSSPGSSPKLASLAAFQSVSRWLTGSPPPITGSVSDLCLAVSALDIARTTRLLFDDSVPVNSRNPAGVPPLIAAIRSPLHQSHPLSHLAMVSLLLDAGADPDTTTASSPASGTMSALAAAASLGRASLIRLLLDRGAAADAKLTTVPMSRFSGHGLTALHVAVFAGQPAAADVLLLSHGRGRASVSATFEGYRAVVGAPQPPSKPSGGGGSPRRHARVWTTGITALHLAAEDDDSSSSSSSSSGPACAALLLRRGADPDARDGFGRGPLHWACMGGGSAEVVRLLLDAGAPADAPDDDGATPLAVLAARLEQAGGSRAGHHQDVVALLLAAGANPDLRYPRDVSVRRRLLAMEEWRGVYEEIFERYALGG